MLINFSYEEVVSKDQDEFGSFTYTDLYDAVDTMNALEKEDKDFWDLNDVELAKTAKSVLTASMRGKIVGKAGIVFGRKAFITFKSFKALYMSLKVAKVSNLCYQRKTTVSKIGIPSTAVEEEMEMVPKAVVGSLLKMGEVTSGFQ